jgi:hypothetical protein
LLYKVWMFINILISLILSIKFYPLGSFEDEFSLFNDFFTIIIYVPSVFILASSIIGLLVEKWYLIISLFIIVLVLIGFKLVSIYNFLSVVFILSGGLLIGCLNLTFTKLLKNRKIN